MPKTQKAETTDSRERILDAAIEVIAQRGYSSAGIQEIVELSGTSKGSFYFHFPSKEEMVASLVERMSDKLIARIQYAANAQPTPLHRLVASLDELMAIFSRQHNIARVLLLNIIGHGKATDRKFLPMRERFSGLIKRDLDEAIKAGQIASTDTELASQMWVGALYEVILRWLLTSQPQNLEAIAPKVRNVLLESVGADADFSAAATREPGR